MRHHLEPQLNTRSNNTCSSYNADTTHASHHRDHTFNLDTAHSWSKQRSAAFPADSMMDELSNRSLGYILNAPQQSGAGVSVTLQLLLRWWTSYCHISDKVCMLIFTYIHTGTAACDPLIYLLKGANQCFCNHATDFTDIYLSTSLPLL